MTGEIAALDDQLPASSGREPSMHQTLRAIDWCAISSTRAHVLQRLVASRAAARSAAEAAAGDASERRAR
jgi:hypothetical protein